MRLLLGRSHSPSAVLGKFERASHCPLLVLPLAVDVRDGRISDLLRLAKYGRKGDLME